MNKGILLASLIAGTLASAGAGAQQSPSQGQMGMQDQAGMMDQGSSQQSMQKPDQMGQSEQMGRMPGQQAMMGSEASMQDPAMIRQVQQALNDAGYDVGQADGVMGPQTQAAIRDFQSKQGISSSGQLDSQTIAALGVEEGGMPSNSGVASEDMMQQGEPSRSPDVQ